TRSRTRCCRTASARCSRSRCADRRTRAELAAPAGSRGGALEGASRSPGGRGQRIDDRLRVGLAMFSAGILAFIFMDVTTNAQAIIAATLDRFKHGHTSFGHVLWLFALLAVGFVT